MFFVVHRANATTALLLCLLMSGFAASSAASAMASTEIEAQDSADVKYQERLALVRSMTNMTLSILQDQKKSFADRERTMQNGITNMLDINWIARSALGISWRGASDEQRERYTGLYRSYLTKMYIANFAQSSERKIRDMKIVGIDNANAERFTVRTELLLSDDKSLSVNYLVADQDNKHKIIDISIEGISLLATHRSEFSAIASARGVDGVIETLQQLVNNETPPFLQSSL